MTFNDRVRERLSRPFFWLARKVGPPIRSKPPNPDDYFYMDVRCTVCNQLLKDEISCERLSNKDTAQFFSVEQANITTT
jgi:hypothetical protein